MKTDEASWSFVSGRAAVLESRMLSAEFFDRLTMAEGPQDVLYALSDTPLAEEFARAEDLRQAGIKVRAVYDGLVAEMRGLSPDPAVVGLLGMEQEFRGLKSYLKRQRLGVDVPAVECDYGDETWQRLWDDMETGLPPWFALARDRVLAACSGRTDDANTLDAALDDAALRALCEAAAAVGSAFVAEYCRRYDTVKGVEVLWRARALRQDEAALGLFVRGRAEAELFEGMARLDEDDWPQLVGQWVDGIEPEALAAADPEQRVHHFVSEADKWLMAFARDAKYVPCGPERVFGCVLGLQAEARNFALVLGGRANDVSPDVLRGLLRACYV